MISKYDVCFDDEVIVVVVVVISVVTSAAVVIPAVSKLCTYLQTPLNKAVKL